MSIQFKNNASTTLASAIDNVTTTITVATGGGASLPTLAASEYFYATIVDIDDNFEIVKVTARATDTLTVVRAQEGTTARSFVSGSRIENRITAQSLRDATTGDYLLL